MREYLSRYDDRHESNPGNYGGIVSVSYRQTPSVQNILTLIVKSTLLTGGWAKNVWVSHIGLEPRSAQIAMFMFHGKYLTQYSQGDALLKGGKVIIFQIKLGICHISSLLGLMCWFQQMNEPMENLKSTIMKRGSVSEMECSQKPFRGFLSTHVLAGFRVKLRYRSFHCVICHCQTQQNLKMLVRGLPDGIWSAFGQHRNIPYLWRICLSLALLHPDKKKM